MKRVRKRINAPAEVACNNLHEPYGELIRRPITASSIATFLTHPSPVLRDAARVALAAVRVE